MVLGLILIILCLSLVVFTYYKQPNQAQTEQEYLLDVADVTDLSNIVIHIDDQQTTLLGEISQRELQFETNDEVEIEPEVKSEVEPEVELTNSEVAEPSQEQQLTVDTSAAVEGFIIDKEVIAQKSTGADLESNELSDEEELQWEQIWELRSMAPVEKNSFKINFNNKSRLFEVTLKDRFAKDKLQSWLVANKFSQIPAAFFLYIVAY